MGIAHHQEHLSALEPGRIALTITILMMMKQKSSKTQTNPAHKCNPLSRGDGTLMDGLEHLEHLEQVK